MAQWLDFQSKVYLSWESWGPWSESCSATCGDAGIRIRSRECPDNVVAGNSGQCRGEGTEKRKCNRFDCEPYAKSCAEWKVRGLENSTRAQIDPTTMNEPAFVYCDLTSMDGTAVTIIGDQNLHLLVTLGECSVFAGYTGRIRRNERVRHSAAMDNRTESHPDCNPSFCPD
ncbi:hypothetical protein CAPTEDRAFT_207351 [Capitella teleta]|uniref:Uncharacterized protein n=1 Tax=Capitella teleta TaxID=283909 RepID=R7UF07_CAPTE|nr:hypothetical protein CAPTEDRAFT_207351 [Capitella teleta]|eukprot:ELU04554.1 hypothetical protein CAPTEDRAFT_207351 [Capitella teleta]